MPKLAAPTLVVGSQGAGKSYFVEYLVMTLKAQFKIIIDPGGEYEIPGFAILELNPWNYQETLQKFPDILKKYKNIIVQFDFIATEDQKKIIDYITALLFNIKNVILVVDEAHLYVGKKKPVQNLINIATMGRKYGITPIYVTQRPQQLNTDVRSMTWFKIAFRLNDMRDVEALRGYLKDIEITMKLPRFYFLYRNAEGETFIGTTVGLKLPHKG